MKKIETFLFFFQTSKRPYRELLGAVIGIGGVYSGADFDSGRRVLFRELSDRQGLEGVRRRRGREHRLVTESSEDLSEDLEEEG